MARKSGSWVFGDATERDTFGVTEGVLPYDTCILEADGSRYYWTGAAWSALSGGGGGGSGGWESVWALDCAAESAKDPIAGGVLLDDGTSRLYLDDGGARKGAVFGFTGSALRLQHASGSTSDFFNATWTGPVAYLLLSNLDPDYHPENMYAMAVDWDLDVPAAGLRMFMAGWRNVPDPSISTAYSYSSIAIGHTGASENVLDTRATVESDTEIESLTDAAIAIKAGWLCGLGPGGESSFSYGNGWSGAAWAAWSHLTSSHCQINDAFTRYPTKPGVPIERRFCLAPFQSITGVEHGATINRLELFRLGGPIA